jgi:hypothetical protein
MNGPPGGAPCVAFVPLHLVKTIERPICTFGPEAALFAVTARTYARARSPPRKKIVSARSRA